MRTDHEDLVGHACRRRDSSSCGNASSTHEPLTQPLLLPNIIAYKGFKALAFVGSASGIVYSIDYDLNRMFWEQKLATSASRAAACSSGLPVLTKATRDSCRPVGAVAIAAAAGAGAPAGRRGEAPPLTRRGHAGAPPAARCLPRLAAAAASAAAAGGGRGRGAGGPQIANGRGGGDNVFAISTGGMVHVMNPQIGTDQIPPVKFLPAQCQRRGIDPRRHDALCRDDRQLSAAWRMASGRLISRARRRPSRRTTRKVPRSPVPRAPTFGTDGTMYIATGAGTSPVANSIVSLERKTLTQKDWFSADASPFTSNPIVFQYKGKDLIVAANKDGRLYVLDSASLGGADHKTPLHKSSPVSSAAADGRDRPRELAGFSRNALDRRRRVERTRCTPDTKFAMANGAVSKGALVAFTVVDQNDVPTLQPQWVSRDLAAPVTPASSMASCSRSRAERPAAAARSPRRPCCMRSTRRRARNSGPAARR